MKNRGYCIATVTKKAQTSLENGHPWVYDSEVISLEGEVENGDIVDVVSQKGSYLGSGFISQKSKIRIRLISRNANDRFDDAFWKRRVEYSYDYRKTVMGENISCCRMIFGEADMFPGLTVDRFENVLVTQVLSIGIEKIKDRLFPIIMEVMKEQGIQIDGIYERNDVAIRQREGLEEFTGWYGKPCDIDFVTICENGIKYKVDFKQGQKTGFFLDQKYNRLCISKYVKGKRVLDCFTHTGSFALNAAKGGAAYVKAVDISESAIECARENAALNNLDVDFEVINVFDLLPTLKDDFDFIILDPPAFTKSRATISNAMRGYKEINFRALKHLRRGGYLATCSCSHFASPELFCKMLMEAAKDAGVSLRQVQARQQAPDHPILWGVDETNYLKFYIFQVV